METWALPQLLGYATLSDHCNSTVEEYFRRRWFMALQHCTGDGEAMRTIMRTTGAVVSGSFALKFLDQRATFAPGDVDCYVPIQGYHTFVTFLVAALGAEIVSEDDFRRQYGKPRPYRYGNLTGIADRRVLRIGKVVIDVICSTNSSPLFPIAKFHSTIVMNFLSADGFCIAYPVSVLLRLSFKTCRRMLSNDRIALNKLQDRGYLVFRSPQELSNFPRDASGCYSLGHCGVQLRFFADEYCITFMFDRFHPSTRARLFKGIGRRSILSRPVASILPTDPYRFTTAWSRGGKGCSKSGAPGDCKTQTYPFIQTTVIRDA